MKTPLWLMLGTAFRFSVKGIKTDRYLLTSKHTFVPWECAKDASQLKIPEEFRKLRFVTGRIYGKQSTSGNAIVGLQTYDEVVLKRVHPTLDVALLEQRSSVNVPITGSVELRGGILQNHAKASIKGFRGLGRLGEMDSLDPEVLKKLNSKEREELLSMFQQVEGKQVSSVCHVTISDHRGACSGESEDEKCYHGMSGSPVLPASQPGTFGGILYGKHTESPSLIGYVPVEDFDEWLFNALEQKTENS